MKFINYFTKFFYLFTLLGLIFFIGCDSFGTSPDEKRIEMYKHSKNFDIAEEKFKNSAR